MQVNMVMLLFPNGSYFLFHKSFPLVFDSAKLRFHFQIKKLKNVNFEVPRIYVFSEALRF